MTDHAPLVGSPKKAPQPTFVIGRRTWYPLTDPEAALGREIGVAVAVRSNCTG
jgi:hypothetical protein